MPIDSDPSLLVGFQGFDDAGVYVLPGGLAIAQTVDFFTPVVDDPYTYGLIAAANALSDIYAMGGSPLTVLNIACFDPEAAPPEVWGSVLQGMGDKTKEAGAVCVGGHTVVDSEPKFGMAVTGIVPQDGFWSNDRARPGDSIYLTKPLGTGLVTTAAKADMCLPEELASAIDSMTRLNSWGRDLGLANGVRCATDVTGFGLAGHLSHVAKNSHVSIMVSAGRLPIFPGLERLFNLGCVTGGAARTASYLGPQFLRSPGVADWQVAVALDPQTSGGLLLFSSGEIAGCDLIGHVSEGPPRVVLEP